MKKFIKFIIKLMAVTAVLTGIAYLVKKFFFDDKEDEFADNYTDLQYELDDDLKPVSEREYVSITPEPANEEAKPAAEEVSPSDTVSDDK